MELTAYLDQQLRAQGIPIVGVSLQSTSDRTGWFVQFTTDATDAQKASAQTLLATIAIDPASMTVATIDKDAQAAMSITAKALCALMLEVKLGRSLTTADIPTVQGMFAKGQTYYKFIVNNGL